jgi:DNA-binding FadR family transcriptional regulator
VTTQRRPGKAIRWFGAAEVIAGRLRDRILNGDIPDGRLLPKQDDLAAEFGVTKAAVRESCRILEAEGLLRVVRGNVGGSVVRVPTPRTAAYTVGLVLQARQTELRDVGLAVERIEPLVAQLCAERPDRNEVVLPVLEATQADLADAIARGDADGASAAARRWHESLAELCGNETVVVLMGTVEAIWSAHARDSAMAAHAEGRGMDLDITRRVYREHDEIQALIRAGDGPGTAAMAQRHLETARIHPARPVEGTVRADTIRDRTL